MKNKTNLSLGLLYFGLVFLLQVGYGQPVKRFLSQSDYDNLCHITNLKLSDYGNYTSYKLQYDNGIDTIVIQNTNTKKKLLFPSAQENTFSHDEKWIAIKDTQNNLTIQNLAKGFTYKLENTVKFEFMSGSNFLIVISKKENIPILTLKNLENGKEVEHENISDYIVNSKGEIACFNNNSVYIIQPHKDFLKTNVIVNSPGKFKKALWSNNGYKLALLEQLHDSSLFRQKHSIYCYNALNKTMLKIDGKNNLSENQIIVAPLGIPPLSFSSDDNILFFYRLSPKFVKNKDKIEIWDSSTPLEYPMQKYHGDTRFLPKATAWSLNDNTINDVATNELPQTRLLPDFKKAIVFNKLAYEPQIEFIPPADFYILDIRSGEKKLFLQKYSSAIGLMGASPNGQHISYFRDNHWWIYNTTKNNRFNATERLNANFSDSEINEPGELPPYGAIGWTSDGKYFIVYDQYDIWLLPANGDNPQRVTKGREAKIKFRIAEDEPNENELNTNYYNLSEGLILVGKGENMGSGWLASQ